jgi:protein-disulfide isomerase
MLRFWPQFWVGLALVGTLNLAPGLAPGLAPAWAAPIDAQLEQQILEVIRKHPDVILDAVDKYQREEQAKQANIQRQAVQKLLSDPSKAIGASPTIGQGKVLLIEFSDFQCPYCASVRGSLKQFAEKYPKDVTFVYKHMPLTGIHDQALSSAQAAWAAGRQGKFWEFQEALFANQKNLNGVFYQKTAAQLGLDLARFDADRVSPAAAQAIAQDVKMAGDLAINGTPTFVMGTPTGGELFSGPVPLEGLEKRLQQIKAVTP